MLRPNSFEDLNDLAIMQRDTYSEYEKLARGAASFGCELAALAKVVNVVYGQPSC